MDKFFTFMILKTIFFFEDDKISLIRVCITYDKHGFGNSRNEIVLF